MEKREIHLAVDLSQISELEHALFKQAHEILSQQVGSTAEYAVKSEERYRSVMNLIHQIKKERIRLFNML